MFGTTDGCNVVMSVKFVDGQEKTLSGRCSTLGCGSVLPYFASPWLVSLKTDIGRREWSLFSRIVVSISIWI